MNTTKRFNSGSKAINPIEASADKEYTIEVEWDFRPDVSPFRDSDWSVTVWGEKGDVTITHSKAGVESDHWPLIPH